MISASATGAIDHGGRSKVEAVDFILITLGMIGLIVLCLVLLARAYPGQRRRPRRLEADALARGRGPARDRRRAADARGAERVPPPARRARADRGRRQPDGARGRGGPRAGTPQPRRSASTSSRTSTASRWLSGAGADRRLRLPRPRARAALCRARLGGARHDPRSARAWRRSRPTGSRRPSRTRTGSATVLDAIEGVALIYWLLGSATVDRGAAELHGPRLERLLEEIVDTPVRGVRLRGERGARAATARRRVRGARARPTRRWRIPFEVVAAEPAAPEPWLEGMPPAAAELVG